MYVKEEGQKVRGVILLNALGQCFRNYFLWCSQLFPKEKEISVQCICKTPRFPLLLPCIDWRRGLGSALELWDLLHIFLTREIYFSERFQELVTARNAVGAMLP